MTTESIKIDDLTPYAKNARRHEPLDIDAIAKSIEAFGFRDPVGVWGPNNIIVEGHGRVMAAKQLGMTEVPCIRLDDLTDEQRRAYGLAHNKTAELSTWDAELLPLEIEELPTYDMTAFGFDAPAGDKEPEHEIEEDDFDEDTDEVEAQTKPGDLWQLGVHRLLCGDSTDPEAIDKLLDGAFARMAITSPPYGVGKDYEEKGIEPWRKTIGGVINAIKGKALIICWNIGDLFSTGSQFTEPTGAYSVQMMSDAGYGMLYNRIWKKPGANFAGNNPYYTVTTKPAQDYEYLFAFAENDADKHLKPLKKYLFGEAKKAAVTNDLIKTIGGPSFMCGHWFTDHQWTLIDDKNYARLQKYCADNGIRAFMRDYASIKDEYLRNTIFSHRLSDKEFSEWGLYGVWEFNTVTERLGGHAAAFPIELPTRYIKMHSYEDDLVLDPFGGTGTTLIACEQLGRKCCMMELDPHYCDVIIARWEKLTGKKAELIRA